MEKEIKEFNKVSIKHLKELLLWGENEIKEWKEFVQTIKKELKGKK